jgi:hypothetical protein
MKKLLPLFLLSLTFILPGCGGGGSTTCSFTGLVANGTYLVVFNNPSTGIATTFTRVATASGTLSVSTNGSCSNVVVVQVNNANNALSASPSSIDLQNPPATATITGQGFDATYGMPRVEYFDASGYMVGSTIASSVSGGGTSLNCPLPSLGQAYSGTYTIRVTNKGYQGYYTQRVGSATVTAYGRDRLDSDGDGWYDDQDCEPYDPYYTNNCGGETCGGYGNVPLQLCGPIQ